MTTIVTRAGKGSPLTNAELDQNFLNLNSDKLEAGALSPYLLSATAASTYQTIAGMSSYLTTAAAALEYLTQASAASTYLTQANAASTYLTQSNAASTYLTQSGAASTYLTQAAASSTYQPLLVSGTNIKSVNGNSLVGSGNLALDFGVLTFNTRSGNVTLGSSDVTGALGFTPADSAALSNYLPLSGGALTGNLGVGDGVYGWASNGTIALTNGLSLTGYGSGLFWNLYYNGGYKYLSTGPGTAYQLGADGGGDHVWSVTEGTSSGYGSSASLVLAMTLSKQKNLRVYGGITAATYLQTNDGTTTAQLLSSDGAGIVRTATNSPLLFQTNANTYFGIGTSGELHVGSYPSVGTSGQFLRSRGSGQSAQWGSLTSSDITTALGYTPLNPGAINNPTINGVISIDSVNGGIGTPGANTRFKSSTTGGYTNLWVVPNSDGGLTSFNIATSDIGTAYRGLSLYAFGNTTRLQTIKSSSYTWPTLEIHQAGTKYLEFLSDGSIRGGSGAFMGVAVPGGTSAQRPTDAVGWIRYNTDTSKLEAKHGTGAWFDLGAGGGGGGGSGVDVLGTTTNATETALGGITIDPDSAAVIEVFVVAKRTDGGGTEMGAWRLQAAVRRVGSANQIDVGSIYEEIIARTDTGLLVDLVSEGGATVIKVTGVAGRTYNWKANFQTVTV